MWWGSWPTSRTTSTCGCMSTPRTAAGPGSPRATPAASRTWSEPTRSRSTRTSGPSSHTTSAPRFRALKLWTSWKHLGTEGFGRLIEHNDDLAAYLVKRCKESGEFEVVPEEPELSVV